jgi:hypothetical protein
VGLALELPADRRHALDLEHEGAIGQRQCVEAEQKVLIQRGVDGLVRVLNGDPAPAAVAARDVDLGRRLLEDPEADARRARTILGAAPARTSRTESQTLTRWCSLDQIIPFQAPIGMSGTIGPMRPQSGWKPVIVTSSAKSAVATVARLAPDMRGGGSVRTG